MTRFKKILWTGLLAGTLLTLPYAASADHERGYGGVLKTRFRGIGESFRIVGKNTIGINRSYGKTGGSIDRIAEPEPARKNSLGIKRKFASRWTI